MHQKIAMKKAAPCKCMLFVFKSDCSISSDNMLLHAHDVDV